MTRTRADGQREEVTEGRRWRCDEWLQVLIPSKGWGRRKQPWGRWWEQVKATRTAPTRTAPTRTAPTRTAPT